MPRPCHADHPPSPATCHLCALVASRADYRARWGETAAAGAAGWRERAAAALACQHRGEEVGQTECQVCNRRVAVPILACAVHGTCTETTLADGIQCCKICPDRSLPAGRQMVVTADGIGDHLVGLAVAARWQREHPGEALTFVARPGAAPWVRLFGGYAHLATGQLPRLPLVHDLASRGGLHYVEAARRLPAALPPVRPLDPAAVAWARPYAGCVVLAPWAGYRRPGAPAWAPNNRVWLPSHWLALERLLAGQGRRVVMIDTDQERNEIFQGDKAVGQSPARVAALMALSSCVVANESGMGHLAGALGVPAVVLSAMLDGRVIHGLWPRTRVIQGPLACSGCRWTGPNFRPACDTVCASLQAIQPDQVAAAVAEIAEAPPGYLPDPALDRALAVMVRQVDTPTWHGGHRLFGRVLRELARVPHARVVETGTVRADDDWGAGSFTLVLGRYLAGAGGLLTSVELDPTRAEFARQRSRGLPVAVVRMDSRLWLAGYEGPPIDLLYLDSLDTDQPRFQEHCLAEAEMGSVEVRPGGLILLDDTWREGGKWVGKGGLAVPWLLGRGWEIVEASYQVLLRRKGG